MDFNRSEKTCYITNFSYASCRQTQCSFFVHTIVLRVMRLRYTRGFIRFSTCARLSLWPIYHNSIDGDFRSTQYACCSISKLQREQPCKTIIQITFTPFMPSLPTPGQKTIVLNLNRIFHKHVKFHYIWRPP